MARADVIVVLMRHGAKPKREGTFGYDYVLDTPLGVLHVSFYEPGDEMDPALWINTRFEDVPRALAVIGDHRGGVYGMNPFSGKWNFTSHVAFLASLQRSVFRSRSSRVADAIYSAWRKVFDEIMPPRLAPEPYDPGFGDNPAIREAANNSVVEGEHEGEVEVAPRETIRNRIKMGRWPALTEDQIERFVAAAHEAERATT